MRSGEVEGLKGSTQRTHGSAKSTKVQAKFKYSKRKRKTVLESATRLHGPVPRIVLAVENGRVPLENKEIKALLNSHGQHHHPHSR